MVLERPALPRTPQPLPTSGPIEWSERFAAEKLPPQWMTIHPPKRNWFGTGRDGLKLTPSSTPIARIPLPSSQQPVSLRFRLDGPRLDVFYAVEPGQWKPVAPSLDASILSNDVAGGFIGVTFGPCAFRP